MYQAPRYSVRRLSALSIAGLYSVAIATPGALLLWMLSSVTPSPVAGQTGGNPSTSQQLLEEARQRLIDRGELPATPQDAFESPVQVIPPEDAEFNIYRLGPGDALFVNVLRFPDLSFQATLDLQGNVIVPLVGVLPLEGLTIAQAQDTIQAALNRYVVNPQVDITLVAQRPVSVTVSGEVVRPGFYPLASPQLTVALFTAGGTTTLADVRKVQIRRSLRNGQLIAQNIDLYTPLLESGSVPDIRLEDGDTVIIPAITAENNEGYDRSLIANSTLAQQVINIRVLNYSASLGGARGGGQLRTVQLPNGSRFVDALTAISPNIDAANMSEIGLVRFDVDQGRAVVQELDGSDALRGDFSQDPVLENNDVIVVGRNFVSRITYALNTFTQPFRDVLGFLLFFDSLTDSADDLFGPDDDDDDD